MTPADGSALPALDKLMDTKELAKHLKKSIATLERWRSRGFGPTFSKLGPGLNAPVVYRVVDVDDWVARNRFASTSEYARRRMGMTKHR